MDNCDSNQSLEKTGTTGTVEEYLEAILDILSERKKVLGARLVERLQVSPPTVTATLKRMRRDDLITAKEQDGILLTKKGMKLAVGIIRRHRLAERFLTDLLKIPWYETHQEACLLEHAMSQRVVDRLYKILGKPATCPHGNPIPTDDVLPPLRGVPLSSIGEGVTVVVERISEEANRSRELMEWFGKYGLHPGAKIGIRKVAGYAGTMTVVSGKKTISLGTKAAEMIWAIPVNER